MAATVVNALVMSAGGARGAFELGVIDYLIRVLRLDFQVITGVSVGAIKATLLAQGAGHSGLIEALDKLEDIWFSIKSDRDIFLKRGPARLIDLPTFMDDLLGGLFHNSIYDLSPLAQKINALISPEALRNSGVELRVGVASLNTGEYIAVTQDFPDIERYVLASASIPFFFPPVLIDGQLYVDGSVRSITPLKDAFEALRKIHRPGNEYRLFVVLASPLTMDPVSDLKRLKTPASILQRAADIMVSEIFNNDLEYARAIAAQVKGAKRKDRLYAEIIVFEPKQVYLGPLEFDPKKIRSAFTAGIQRAQEVTRHMH
ncbi:MAG: patatin-like phospholipase family protein [Candidatus Bipolaricaulia bacterium]